MTDLTTRGYRFAYHGPETHCPSCDSSSWLVGRRLAECARCGCAIPLAPPRRKLPLAVGAGVGATVTLLGWIWWRRRSGAPAPAAAETR